MEIKRLDLSQEALDYISDACRVLRCSPSQLITDALLIHCKAFRIINSSVMNALDQIDEKNLLNHGN